MKLQTTLLVALATALSMSSGAQIVALSISANHISGGGTYIPAANAVSDAYNNGFASANGSDLNLFGTGGYTYKLPGSSESGQVYSYLTTTLTIGEDPIRINSYNFGGSGRTVVSGGLTTPLSTLNVVTSVVDVFNEGDGFLKGPVYHNNGPIVASLSNNSFADWTENASAPSLVGAILAPHTKYTLTEAMLAQYSFTRAEGDNFTYAITQEFGAFGPSGNYNFADIKYTTLPEPASMFALVVGGVGLIRRRRKNS